MAEAAADVALALVGAEMPTSVTPDEVVESLLVAVSIDAADAVSFTFKQGTSRFRLRVGGVVEFCLAGFSKQNILQELHLHDKDSDPSDVRKLVAFVFFGHEDLAEIERVGSVHTKRIEKTLEDITAGRVLLIELEPVVGAWGAVLAKRIEWIEPEGHEAVTAS